MFVVALYTELFQAIIPTSFLCFCHSAIPTSHYIFNVFFLLPFTVWTGCIPKGHLQLHLRMLYTSTWKKIQIWRVVGT